MFSASRSWTTTILGPQILWAAVKSNSFDVERRKRGAHRNWGKNLTNAGCGNTEGEQDEHERGEVELCLRWCHDKSRAYDLPKEFKAVEKAGSKAMPNELHVYLVEREIWRPWTAACSAKRRGPHCGP